MTTTFGNTPDHLELLPDSDTPAAPQEVIRVGSDFDKLTEAVNDFAFKVARLAARYGVEPVPLGDPTFRACVVSWCQRTYDLTEVIDAMDKRTLAAGVNNTLVTFAREENADDKDAVLIIAGESGQVFKGDLLRVHSKQDVVRLEPRHTVHPSSGNLGAKK